MAETKEDVKELAIISVAGLNIAAADGEYLLQEEQINDRPHWVKQASESEPTQWNLYYRSQRYWVIDVKADNSQAPIATAAETDELLPPLGTTSWQENNGWDGSSISGAWTSHDVTLAEVEAQGDTAEEEEAKRLAEEEEAKRLAEEKVKKQEAEKKHAAEMAAKRLAEDEAERQAEEERWRHEVEEEEEAKRLAEEEIPEEYDEEAMDELDEEAMRLAEEEEEARRMAEEAAEEEAMRAMLEKEAHKKRAQKISQSSRIVLFGEDSVTVGGVSSSRTPDSPGSPLSLPAKSPTKSPIVRKDARHRTPKDNRRKHAVTNEAMRAMMLA